ncbi:MAG: site-2 protease family protein [Proteobacteria bacterium]|nr:site-2 protease family protein [Pseudomonadota bacterium]
MDFDVILKVFVMGVPIILAVTLHEAAHGYVALHYGDDTALRAGRLTLNPFAHVDMIGTILIPGILLLTGAPFLFGYAKPVPVNFDRLDHPRLDMASVALAGPLTNIFLAFVSAFAFHLIDFFPSSWADSLHQALSMSVMINVTLALFNMIPLPPLDGGRVAVGLLPNLLAEPLARLERYGMFILFGLIFFVPFVTQKLGNQIDPISWLLHKPREIVLMMISKLAGIA